MVSDVLIQRLRARADRMGQIDSEMVHEAADALEAAKAENERLKERLSDTPVLVLDALAEIATQATQAMSDEAIRSVMLAHGDDPELASERVRAIIGAALGKEVV